MKIPYFSPILALSLYITTSPAALIVHSSMDNVDVGAGSGTDDAATASFSIKNSQGTDGTATTDNATGTVTSGITGQIGQAVNFSNSVGGNRRVSYGDNFDVGSGSYSVSLWINSRIGSTAPVFIASKGNNSSATNGWSIWSENNLLFLRGEYTGSDNTTQNLAVSRAFGAGEQNAWHHVVLVIDNVNGLWSGYYDGASSGASGTDNGWSIGGGGGDTITFTPGRDFSNASELYLGLRNDLATEWPGALDDFAVWDEALTPAQVSTIYTNGLNGIGVPEPSIPALALFGLSFAIFRRRRC